MRGWILTLTAALGLVTSAGCAGASRNAPNQPPPPERRGTDVELTVRDVDDDLLEQLQAELARSKQFKGAQLKSRSGKTAVFTVTFRDDVEELPEALAQLPHPGLRFGSALHKVEISAFDNQPPQLSFIHPQPEQVLNQREQFITVEVPDKDLASLTIDGKPAPAYKGRLYRSRLTLGEGRQEVVAIARDKAGNETVQKVAVVVDTTPPALNAQIRLVVEGMVEPGSTVLIDGQEVSVGSDGRYRAEVPVRKGQKKVEVIAIDQTGNKTVTHRDIGN
jgi:hypothetical protein